jgi:hypothetical protein
VVVATLCRVDRAKSVVTAERFAQGMTFDQYVAYTGTAENLAFLNVKDGQTFQTVPTVVFLTKALEVLHIYFEFPAIYHKMRLAELMGVPTSRENREQEWERFIRDWGTLQESPFWQVWTSAAVDEMISALHERLVAGS